MKKIAGFIAVAFLLAACSCRVEPNVALPVAPHARGVINGHYRILPVGLAKDGEITLGRTVVTTGELADELIRLARKKIAFQIVLRVDKDTPMFYLTPLIETCADADPYLYLHYAIVVRGASDAEATVAFQGEADDRGCGSHPPAGIPIGYARGELMMAGDHADRPRLIHRIASLASRVHDCPFVLVLEPTNSVQDVVGLMDICLEGGATNLVIARTRTLFDRARERAQQMREGEP